MQEKPSVIKELEEESDNRVFTGPAKRIIDKLAPMSSHVEVYQRRWFWELLQNACDYNDQVKIEIEVNKEFLYFRHNGSTFTMAQALNLILPDSDKDETEQKDIIGRYGSGFLSTHILSTEIWVKGFLKTKANEVYDFSFSLDRAHRGDKEKNLLANSLQKSREEFKENLTLAELPSGYTTEFKYNLSKTYSFVTALETVTKGFSFLREAIPYVFAFQPKLSEVVIKVPNKTRKYFCEQRTANEVITKVEQTQNGESRPDEEIVIRLGAHDSAVVATEVKNGVVIPLKDEVPRIFKVYPLIGTEQFPFPCIFHSLDLIPTLERNSIELSDQDISNRLVLENAQLAYNKLLVEVSKDHSAIYNISCLQSGTFETKVQEWFKINVSDKLKQTLFKTPVVLTSDGKRVGIGVIKVPIIEESQIEDFFGLVNDTIFQIPAKDDVKRWGEVLNFSVFTEVKLDPEKLLNSVYEKNSPKPYSEYLKVGVDVNAWLKRLIKVLINSDRKKLLYEYPIISQQDGKCRPLKSDLYWDDSIDEKLKDVLELISKDSYRKILMHPDLGEFGDELLDSKKEKTENDILDAIDKALQKAAENPSVPEFIEALRRILSWTKSMNDADLKSKMPWFAGERAVLVMKTLASDENRDMAFRIIQSGKMEILAKLAESSISAEKLDSILAIENSGTSVEVLRQIAEISHEVPIADILEAAKELQVEVADKQFKTRQGNAIEKLVEDLMNEDGLNKNYSCKLIGFGESDFVITNTRNEKKAFLEIKSHAHGSTLPSKLYLSQAKKAVSCIGDDNFILGVVTRPNGKDDEVTEYIRQHMRFIFGIGTKLKPMVEQYSKLEPYYILSDGVSVDLKENEVRFLVSRNITDNGYPFGGFKARLKQILD